MKFELQPTLKGVLLELRPLEHEDFEALYAVAADPLIWEQHPFFDRYKRDVFENYFKGAMESGGAFAILDSRTGEVIGSTRYYELNWERNEIEIGYTFLARKYWGGFYNRELKTLMLDHAFRFVDAVVFRAGEKNMRSRRALEKIGARFVERVEVSGPDGRVRVNCLYRIEPSFGSDAR